MRTRLSSRRVFLLFACLYILSLGHGFYSSDGEVMFQTAAALAERGTFELPPDPALPQIVPGADGAFYSKYDPGLPLLAVPFYAAGDWLGEVNHAHRYRLAAIGVLLLPALAGAVAVAALHGLAASLFPPRRAQLVTLAAGLGALLWSYSRMLFPEAVLAACLTLAVWAIDRGRRARHAGPAWIVIAGGMLGVGILTRAALAIYIPALALLVAGWLPPAPWPQQIKRLALFLGGMIPFALALLWHNWLRFDDLLQSGYGGEGFPTPLWKGVPGLLISPGKGVLVYAPPLILCLLLWPRFRRVYPALGAALALAWIIALVFFGAWWAWYGGWSWGPRFLVPLVPLSCLPLGMLPARPAWRRAAALLIALGIAINVLGVLTDFVPYYSEVFAGDARDEDAARYDRIHFQPDESPLIEAARRLAAGKTEPLAVFHLDDSGLPPTWTVGVPAGLLAGLLAGLAGAMAARRGRWRATSRSAARR